MSETRHFMKVTALSLARLVAALDVAAAVLDQKGSRPLRKRLLDEAHLAVGALRALDNSLNGFGIDGVRPTDLLGAEQKMLGELKRPSTVRMGTRPRHKRPSAEVIPFPSRGVLPRVVTNHTDGGPHAA